MREIYDEDCLLFYTQMRSMIQIEFGIQFKLKEKILHQDNAKRCHSSGTIVVQDHTKLTDGTQVVSLSPEACKHVLLKLLRKKHAAHYIVNKVMKDKFRVVKTEKGAMVRELLSIRMRRNGLMYVSTGFRQQHSHKATSDTSGHIFESTNRVFSSSS